MPRAASPVSEPFKLRIWPVLLTAMYYLNALFVTLVAFFGFNFTEPQEAICGNGVVEPGEQCDCGWEEDCKDSCCYPMSRHPRFDQKPCTLTP